MATNSTTTRTYTEPTGGPADIIGRFKREQGGLESMLKAVTGSAAANADAAGLAAERAGAAVASAHIAKGEVEAKTNEKIRSNSAILGVDVADPNSSVMQARVAMEKAKIDRTDLAARIDEQESVQWYEDPLAYIVNQITLPQLIQAHNVANMRARTAEAEVESTIRQAQALQNLNPANVAEDIRQHAAGLAAQSAFVGIEQHKKALVEANAIQANGIMQQLAGVQTRMQGEMRLAEMFREDRRLAEADSEMKALQPALDRANLKRMAMGLPKIEPIEFKNMTPAKRSEIVDFGLNVRGQVYAIGDSPGASYSLIVGTGAAPTIGQTMPAVRNLLVSQMQSEEFKTRKQLMVRDNPKFANLSPVEQDAVVLDTMSADQAKAVNTRDKNGVMLRGHNKLEDSNPYKFKPAEAATHPELANNIFAKEVATQHGKNPLGKITHDDVLQMFEAKVIANAGKPGAAEALVQQFSDFYRQGSMLEWQRRGMAQAGYVQPEGFAFSNDKTADYGQAMQAWNPADVMSYAVRVQVNANSVRSSPFGSSFGISR